MLGFEGNAMRCSDVQYLSPLYLSGELDSRSMAEFDGHLEGCGVCRTSVLDMQDLDRGVKTAFLDGEMDAAALRLRVLAQIDAEQKKPLPWKRSSVVGRAFATAAALCVAVGLTAAHRENSRYEQASMDHVNEVVMAQPKAWHTEANGMEGYIEERIDTANGQRLFSVPGYQLIQAKECELAQKRYVHMVYGNGLQRVSVYVLSQHEHSVLRKLATSFLPPLRSRTEAGYNVTEGDYKGQRVLLVSTLSQGEEQRIVSGVLHEMG